MTPLEHIIREKIARDGGMTVAEYMTLCLAHPEHGYYQRPRTLGAEGDFITAPEASQIFGELIGAWIAAGWQAAGRPDPFLLVEAGPGRGLLMQDLLRAAGHMPGFLDAVRIHLIETSAALKQEQKRRLEPLGLAIAWHERIDDVPEGPLFFVGNEFLDALPVHHFVKKDDRFVERLVSLDETGALCFVDAGVPLADEAMPAWAKDLPEGSIIELSPERDAFSAMVAARVAMHGGAALFIDYGHAQPGAGETLQAVRRHRPVSVFHEPGRCDLTAHVDFSAVASAMAAKGVDVYGPMEQGPFLRALGLELRLQALLKRADARRRMILKRGAKRIADDDQMGRLFKVLAAVPGGANPPAPFTRGQRWQHS